MFTLMWIMKNGGDNVRTRLGQSSVGWYILRLINSDCRGFPHDWLRFFHKQLGKAVYVNAELLIFGEGVVDFIQAVQHGSVIAPEHLANLGE